MLDALNLRLGDELNAVQPCLRGSGLPHRPRRLRVVSDLEPLTIGLGGFVPGQDISRFRHGSPFIDQPRVYYRGFMYSSPVH